MCGFKAAALGEVVPHAGDVDRNTLDGWVAATSEVVPHAGDVDRNSRLASYQARCRAVVPHAGDVDRNFSR